MSTLLYIALAGALGSVCRHLLGTAVQRASGVAFPWGTLAVNVLGSFCIGLAMALFAQRGQLDAPLRLALTAGFLGGFTTYSAFAFETVQLVERHAFAAAILYVTATVVTAAVACALGLALVRWLS
ncbi:MAG TPA: fluoride efflux transporter CrcB [Haliangium sp.]|nr:fluoride efflux transporter CrcB [Haliangium sp.]